MAQSSDVDSQQRPKQKPAGSTHTRWVTILNHQSHTHMYSIQPITTTSNAANTPSYHSLEFISETKANSTAQWGPTPNPPDGSHYLEVHHKHQTKFDHSKASGLKGRAGKNPNNLGQVKKVWKKNVVKLAIPVKTEKYTYLVNHWIKSKLILTHHSSGCHGEIAANLSLFYPQVINNVAG